MRSGDHDGRGGEVHWHTHMTHLPAYLHCSYVVSRSLSLFPLNRFRIDNTDHIVDVNRGTRHSFEYDQVNLICPFYPSSPSKLKEERYIIYLVNKEE